jgi:hypothetical protein
MTRNYKEEGKGRCWACGNYKKWASDDGAKFKAGGCGSRKILPQTTLHKLAHELDDELMYSSALDTLKVGPNFGCIHWH